MTLRVVPAGTPDLPWRWAEVLHAQEQGADPLGAWRVALALGTQRQHQVPVPPSMPSAFVLQWCLQVAAEAGVQGALALGLVVDPAAGRLSFALHPAQHYPVGLQLRERPGTTAWPDALADRLDDAHAAYLDAGTRLALTYQSPARLGPHQRAAMVTDVWAMALASARGESPPRRASCCYLYVLPGVHECSGCPRLAGPVRS